MLYATFNSNHFSNVLVEFLPYFIRLEFLSDARFLSRVSMLLIVCPPFHVSVILLLLNPFRVLYYNWVIWLASGMLDNQVPGVLDMYRAVLFIFNVDLHGRACSVSGFTNISIISVWLAVISPLPFLQKVVQGWILTFNNTFFVLRVYKSD